MAYLELDGIAIPVAAASPRLSIEEIGSRGRSLSGQAIMGVRGVKRSWEIKTPPLTGADARALATLLQARGKLWLFDGDANTTDGYAPPVATGLEYLAGSGAGVATRAPYAGKAISDDVIGGPGGNKSLAMAPAADNLDDIGVYSFETPASPTIDHFVAEGTGISVAFDATETLHGARSLKITSTGVATDGRVSFEPASALDEYTHVVSMYLYSDREVEVGVWFGDSHDAPEYVVYSLKPGVWQRCWDSGSPEVGGPNTSPYVRIALLTAEPHSVWVDCVQVEYREAPSYPWIAPADARATGGSLELIDATHTPFVSRWGDEWSISFWAKPSFSGGASYIANSSELTIYLVETDLAVSAKLSGVLKTIEDTTSLSAYAWNLITLSQAMVDGRAVMQLIVNDGDPVTVEHGYGPVLDLSTITALAVGEDFGGLLSQLLVVPCRLTERWHRARYNDGAGGTFGAWPRHRMTGEIVGGRSAIDVYARVTGAEPSEFGGADGWHADGQTISFDLVEV